MWFYLILLFLITANVFFGGEYDAWLSRHVSREGGWDTGGGIFNSTKPNSRILIENPLPAGKIQKKWVRWIHFNGNIHSTTFDRTHSAKSKVPQSRILPFMAGLAQIIEFVAEVTLITYEYGHFLRNLLAGWLVLPLLHKTIFGATTISMMTLGTLTQ